MLFHFPCWSLLLKWSFFLEAYEFLASLMLQVRLILASLSATLSPVLKAASQALISEWTLAFSLASGCEVCWLSYWTTSYTHLLLNPLTDAAFSSRSMWLLCSDVIWACPLWLNFDILGGLFLTFLHQFTWRYKRHRDAQLSECLEWEQGTAFRPYAC